MNKNNLPATLTLLAAACAGIAAPAARATSLFDGNTADVFVYDAASGLATMSFSVSSGGWTDQAVQETVTSTRIFFDDGTSNTLIGSVDTSSQMVLVNATGGSLQGGVTGIDPRLPQVSLTGLGNALSDAADDGVPGLTVDPPGGDFDQTFTLTMTGIPARANSVDPVTIFYDVDGIGVLSETPAGAGERAVFSVPITEDGVYDIDIWTEQGGKQSAVETVSYTLTAVDGPDRDVDGDGVPDIIEAYLGMDPLVADFDLDSDGDGWSDFEELVRGTNPDDAAVEPADSDSDGWSDFDETIRGTDPNQSGVPLELTGKPSARRLREVELCIDGTLWNSTDRTTALNSMAQFSARDISWSTLYDQQDLLTLAELAELDPPVPDPAVLPSRFQKAIVDNDLLAGRLPSDLRLPVSKPVILRARRVAVSGTPKKLVEKAWIDGVPDATPADLAAWAADNGVGWSDVGEWLALYVDYLEDTLVRDVTIDMDPATGLGTALVEGALAWYDDTPGSSLVLLGHDEGPQPANAVDTLRKALAATGRNFNALHDELSGLTAAGQELEGFADTVAIFYSSPDNTPDLTTTRSAAGLAQGVGADPGYSYITHLLSVVSLAQIEALPALSRTMLMSSGLDFDGDGLGNSLELSSAERHTLPTELDSDADGIRDDYDPCGWDALNVCLSQDLQSQDSDGDGIADAIDNCLFTANADQTDSNADGIGDLCVGFANILTPTSNLNLLQGQAVEFTSIVTELGLGLNLGYDWDFDGGATDSTAASPGLVVFNTPGTYNVLFSVGDTDNPGQGMSEPRTITVLALLIDSDGDGVADDLDGFPNDPDNSGAIVQLFDGLMDGGSYGLNFGASEHASRLLAVFDGDGEDRLLHVQGYDIDTDIELELIVNGTVFGTLSMGDDNANNRQSVWWLPGSALQPGQNEVEFRNTVPDTSWGVSQLAVYLPGQPFGMLSGVDELHPDGFELHIPATVDGNLLELDAYDSDSDGEMTLLFEGQPFAALPSGPDAAYGERYHLLLAADRTAAFDNLLLIENAAGDPDDWAVALHALRPGGAELGMFPLPDGASDTAHIGALNYLLPQDTVAREIGIELYDATLANEVGIVQDGLGGGFVSSTAPLAWGAAELLGQAAGAQSLITLDNTYNPPAQEIWGARIVSFDEVVVDTDSDGVNDAQDNCTLVANPDQRDTNGDGFGNLCDADLDDDGDTDFIDLSLLKAVFFTSDPDADFDGDGQVNFGDLNIMKQLFFQPPGPAAGGA